MVLATGRTSFFQFSRSPSMCGDPRRRDGRPVPFCWERSAANGSVGDHLRLNARAGFSLVMSSAFTGRSVGVRRLACLPGSASCRPALLVETSDALDKRTLRDQAPPTHLYRPKLIGADQLEHRVTPQLEPLHQCGDVVQPFGRLPPSVLHCVVTAQFLGWCAVV